MTTVVPAANASGGVNLLREAADRRLMETQESSLPILSVRWGQTVNTGNYSSVRLDAEALVSMGSDPGSTLEALREWVREQLPLSDTEQADAVYQTRQLRDEIADLERDAAAARAAHGRLIAWCTAMHITLPSQVTEDLPF